MVSLTAEYKITSDGFGEQCETAAVWCHDVFGGESCRDCKYVHISEFFNIRSICIDNSCFSWVQNIPSDVVDKLTSGLAMVNIEMKKCYESNNLIHFHVVSEEQVMPFLYSILSGILLCWRHHLLLVCTSFDVANQLF